MTVAWLYYPETLALSRDYVTLSGYRCLLGVFSLKADVIPNILWRNILLTCRPQSFH